MIDTKAIRERADKATPGPWDLVGKQIVNERHGLVVYATYRPEDADFIAHAREDIPALRAALAAAEARAERLAAVVQAQIDAKQIEWEDQLTVTPKMIADNLGWSLAAPGWEQERAAWLGLLPGDVKDGHYER